MKKLVIVLLVLCCSGVCGAANYYVDPAASDANDGLTPMSAEKTIAAAIADCKSGNANIYLLAGDYSTTTQGANWAMVFASDNNNITIKPDPATNPTITILTTNTSYSIYGGCNSSTITFQNISITPADNTACIWKATTKSCSFVFYNVTFDDSAADNYFLNFPASGGVPSGSITFNDCNIILPNQIAANCLQVVDCDSFILTNSHITRTTGTGYYILSLDDNSAASVNNLVRITGNTFDIAGVNGGYVIKAFAGYIGICEIRNNIINQSTAGCSGGIYIGLDTGDFTTNVINGLIIADNTITQTGSTSGHLIGAGRNTYGALIENNICSSTDIDDYGIVVKGQSPKIIGNIVKASNAIFVAGARNAVVRYNTAIALGTVAMLIHSNQNGDIPYNPVIEDNIFDGSGGTWALQISKNADLSYYHYDSYINNNCYVAGSTGTIRLNNTSYTLATVKPFWANWSSAFANVNRISFPLNDANSIEADPQFIDAANGNFTLLPSSPCINTGMPTVLNGYTTIGAWQPGISADFDDDGIVGFGDFAIFAGQWQEEIVGKDRNREQRRSRKFVSP